MSIYTQDPRDSLLNIQLKGGVLTITIGIDEMCKSISEGRQSDQDRIRITNNDVFAEAVTHQVGWEDAEGSTLVHAMLDLAAERAIIDDQCNGVEAENVL